MKSSEKKQFRFGLNISRITKNAQAFLLAAPRTMFYIPLKFDYDDTHVFVLGVK